MNVKPAKPRYEARGLDNEPPKDVWVPVTKEVIWTYVPVKDGKGGWCLVDPEGKIETVVKVNKKLLLLLWEKKQEEKEEMRKKIRRNKKDKKRKIQKKPWFKKQKALREQKEMERREKKLKETLRTKIIVRDLPVTMERIPKENLLSSYAEKI